MANLKNSTYQITFCKLDHVRLVKSKIDNNELLETNWINELQVHVIVSDQEGFDMLLLLINSDPIPFIIENISVEMND